MASPTLYPQELLPVEKIVDDGRNPRLSSRRDRQKIEELEKSVGLDGLLQPILVFRDDGLIHLVFGNRRLEVAKRLQWKKVPCSVMDHVPDDAERERLRAIENLNRQDLNPAEEALLVMQMVEACGNDAEAAAAELGRTERWVRDRLYLRGLTVKVRDRLADGELTLGQAREIVKWGDPRDQVRVALRVLDEQRIGGPVSIEEIRGWHDEEKRPLKSVAWDPTIPFAGKPSCSECEFNSANNAGLFGLIKKGKDTDAFCALPTCYQAKADKCGEELRRQAEKTKAQVKDKFLSAESAGSMEVAKSLSPAWLKPEIMQATIRGIIPPAPAAAANASTKQVQHETPLPKKATDKERRQAAVLQWAVEFRKWRAAVANAIVAAGAKDPHKKLCQLLLEHAAAWVKHPVYWAPFTLYEFTGANKGAIEPADEEAASPALVRILTCIASGTYQSLLEMAEAAKGDWEEREKLADIATGPELTRSLAKAFGVKTSPPPAFDFFLPSDLRPAIEPPPASPANAADDDRPLFDPAKPFDLAADKSGWIHVVSLPQAHIKISTPPGPDSETFTAGVIGAFGAGTAADKLNIQGINNRKIYHSAEEAVLSACDTAEKWLLETVSRNHKRDAEKISAVLKKLNSFMKKLITAIDAAAKAEVGAR